MHVEIFLGGETGEATIGARFQKGVVSIFPSYKFVSKSWDLVRHHFRSIDSWLDGRCVSCCPDHAWVSESSMLYAAAGRKSIFNDEEEGDEGAGDELDDDEPDSSAPHTGRACSPSEDQEGGGDGDWRRGLSKRRCSSRGTHTRPPHPIVPLLIRTPSLLQRLA